MDEVASTQRAVEAQVGDVVALVVADERQGGVQASEEVVGELPVLAVPLAQVPEKRLGSLVGARLLALHPHAAFAGYWIADTDTGCVQVGLRSEDSRVDVAHVAARFGGGGHRNAAGFSCRDLTEVASG